MSAPDGTKILEIPAGDYVPRCAATSSAVYSSWRRVTLPTISKQINALRESLDAFTADQTDDLLTVEDEPGLETLNQGKNEIDDEIDDELATEETSGNPQEQLEQIAETGFPSFKSLGCLN